MCAVLFAVYIVYLDVVSHEMTTVQLVFIQMFANGLMRLVARRRCSKRPGCVPSARAIAAIIYLTLLATRDDDVRPDPLSEGHHADAGGGHLLHRTGHCDGDRVLRPRRDARGRSACSAARSSSPGVLVSEFSDAIPFLSGWPAPRRFLIFTEHASILSQSMTARAHMIVRGLVQGVGFRWFVARRANALGLAGYARNLVDGAVEIEAEGDRSMVEELIGDVRVGPAFCARAGPHDRVEGTNQRTRAVHHPIAPRPRSPASASATTSTGWWKGRPLILGGVEIPSPKGLDGHSDADVVLHAIADALLGAAALGDIGRHFPNTDPRYKGISSLILLGQVAELLRKHRFAVVNVDITLLLEAPKIAPHVDRMRGTIAGRWTSPRSRSRSRPRPARGWDSSAAAKGPPPTPPSF